MSDPESISSGRSFPQWMRSRPDIKFDVEGGTAFSPPAHDDSFFYIRYPVGTGGGGGAGAANNNTKGVQNMQSLSDALQDVSKMTTIKTTNLSAAASSKNFAKHTEPCKMFLNNNSTGQDNQNSTPLFANIKNQTKPFGTDDGFDGEGAACGTSIVKVARQMVSGKSLARGFTVANFSSADIEAHPEQYPLDGDSQKSTQGTTKSTNQQTDQAATDFMGHPKYMVRRGSKSLPASPLSSPKSMRKFQPNPYFTGQFASAATTTTNNGTGGGGGGGGGSSGAGGWFLSSLLGIQQHRDVANSTASMVSNISEEAEEAIELSTGNSIIATTTTSSIASTMTAATSTTNPSLTTTASAITNATANFTTTTTTNPKVLKAKPSELREMNFWSPTSM